MRLSLEIFLGSEKKKKKTLFSPQKFSLQTSYRLYISKAIEDESIKLTGYMAGEVGVAAGW